MKDSLTAGLDKSKMSVEQLLGLARRASIEINGRINEQRKVIDGVNADLGRMERQLQSIKPGAGQRELLVEISACKKVLAEELGVLADLERRHEEARQGVSQLEREYRKVAAAETQAATQSKSLAARIAEQKDVVRQVTSDVRSLQKAYENAMPGHARNEALADLTAAKRTLEEEKGALAELTAEQEKNRDSNRRLSRQLRELQEHMARMRLNGEQNSEEYRQMAQEAARLSDTLGDLRTQTSILAHDDANLQGLMSGINGLSGAFTTATGVMSLFASENENLQRVQTRVQGVMAITMGLQQAFNALNKDSAFRLVTVAKAKNLLTAANYRLATALGISTTAATALMAALTLGLSVAITGLVAAWNKYSDAQDEANRKAREMVETESQGRAQMIKTRFEIDTTRKSLKNFTGSKREEKEICDDLNRKYGEVFGYYDTVAQWYDTLTQKAGQYIQTLFLQAKAQALVNQAVEADEELNKHKATHPGNADTDMGFFAKMGLYIAASETGYDAYGAIERHNRAAYDNRTKELEGRRDSLLQQAEELQRQQADIAKSNGIGGHTAPEKGGRNTSGTTTKKAEEHRASELSALMRKNIQTEIDLLKEGSEKKRRQIEENYKAEMAELSALEEKWRAAQRGSLTKDQESTLAESRSLSEKKRKAGEAEIEQEEVRKTAELRKEETEAMVEYLRTWGSFQQKKLAIAEEYAQRIADVDSSSMTEQAKEWRKFQLRKERQKQEAALTFENISDNIDWNALFSGVGNLAKEMAVPMMEQLRAYTETDGYRHADAQTQQQVAEMIQELRKYVGTDQSVTWQTLAAAMDDFTAAVARYDAARKSEEQAVAARERGKAALADGKITGKEYKALEDRANELGDATALAHDEMEGFARVLNNTSDEVANYTSSLSAALANAKTWKGVEGFGDVKGAVDGIDNFKGTIDTSLKEMGDGMAKTIGTSLSGTIGSGLSSLGNGIGGLLSSGMGQIVGIAAQIPRLILDLANGIKSFVTGILDSFTELLSLRWIDDLVVSILDAVGNLVNAIFDLPENLYKVLESIVVDGVGGLVNSVVGRVGNVLTLGALSSKGPSDWFTNSNAEEVASTIERLTERNETLEQAIEDLTDEMKTARGSTAIRSAEEAMRLQRQTNENYKQIAQAQASYHSAHHSWGYYWGGYNDEQKARLSGQIGRQWNGDIWDLSPEEMKQLRSNVDMWDLIKNTGEGPYGAEVQNKLNDYIDQAGKLEEITATLYENLTTTTKENVFDDFLGSLYDLADGSADVMDGIADNWQEMVNRMAVNNLVGAKFQKNLEDWYERLGKVNEQRTQGLITDEEYRRRLNALKGEYEGYVQDARNDIETFRREGIIQETADGSSRSQSGKAGAFTAMSQDQGTKLEGLFVSGQMHWASIDGRMEDVAGRMGTVCDKLAQIEAHTGSSASALGEIREDIKKMIRDGVKVR